MGKQSTHQIHGIEWLLKQQEETKKIEMIQSKIKQVKFTLQSNNNKIKQEFPQNAFESWNEVNLFLNEKFQQINSKLNKKQDIETQTQKDVQTCEIELKDIENQFQQFQSRKTVLDSVHFRFCKIWKQ